MIRPNSRNVSGFTLIEILLASVILAIIGTLTWGAIAATFKTQQTMEERTELQEIGTATLYKVREDIGQAFHVMAPRPLTFFKGEDNLDHDRIEFTSMSHSPSAPNAKESDQAEITYVTESDPENPQLYRLKRRETRHLDGQPENDGDFAVLATNVLAFNLEYSDGQDFKPAWDIRSVDQLHKLPKAVRVTLKLRDAREREETFVSLVEIAMVEDISLERPAPTPVPGLTPTPNGPGGRPGPPGAPRPPQAPIVPPRGSPND